MSQRLLELENCRMWGHESWRGPDWKIDTFVKTTKMTLSRQNLLEGVDFKYLPHNTLTIFYKFLPEGYLKTQNLRYSWENVFSVWLLSEGLSGYITVTPSHVLPLIRHCQSWGHQRGGHGSRQHTGVSRQNLFSLVQSNINLHVRNKGTWYIMRISLDDVCLPSGPVHGFHLKYGLLQVHH